MEAPNNEQILEKLRERFGESVLTAEESYDMLTLTVEPETVLPLFRFLYQEPGLEFQFLTDLCGMHDERPPERLGVVYHVRNMPRRLDLRIKAFMPKEKPEIDSLTSLYASADWQERETYDFFGIIFKGHPNLKRILNVDDMDYFPLWKEYPLEDGTRTDKNDGMFGR